MGVNSRPLSVCYLDAGGVKWRQRAKCRGETFWSSTAVGLKLWALVCGTKREGGRTFPIRGVGLHSIQLRCSCEAAALRTAQAVAEECAWSPPGGSYTSLSPTANVR